MRAKLGKIFYGCVVLLGLFAFSATQTTWGAPVDLTGTPVSAYNDRACIATRYGWNLGCSASEFVVDAGFSAAPETSPFCVYGEYFEFLVDLHLSGSNADRYDITFYAGQESNSPSVYDPTKLCSATAFPLTLANPWANLDGGINNCSDYIKKGDSIVRINKIKVKCMGDATGLLSVPYTIAYEQNTGSACTVNDPASYPIPGSSKCQTGTSAVSGTVKVFSGAYVDVTKQTIPDGDSQAFTFNASGPAGSYIMALTGSTTLDLPQPIDGTYTPTYAADATNSVSGITLTDNNTARFYINALTAGQILTITEAETTNWETTASITCSNVKGTPNPTFDNATRTITTTLTPTNSAAACTITNTKRPRITLAKSINARIDPADQFTVSASGGGNLTGTTSATTTDSNTYATTTFYSTPNTALTLTDAKASPGGGPTPLADYDTRLTCTNAFTGPGATPNASLPNNLNTSSASITPAPGDNITCTYLNSRRPTIAKSFGVSSIASGGNTSLTVTIGNTNAGALFLTSLFTDTLPTGMTIGTAGNTGTCTGVTATAGAGSFTIANGASIPAGGCTVIVNVTSSTPGAAVNTIAAGDLQTTAGNNVAAATATLNVYAPPTVTKSFTPSNIGSGGTSSMVITVTNPGSNPGNLTGVSISDTYSGTITNNASGSVACSGAGSATLTGGVNGGTTVGFTGGTIVPGGTCTITQSVTATSTSTNTTGAPSATGPVALTGTAAGPVTLTVSQQPNVFILKSADKSNASPGEIITYTVQVKNDGAGPAHTVTLTDSIGKYVALPVASSFTLTQGAPASGLTLGTPMYSNDHGGTFAYTLVSGAGGAPANYDGMVTDWKIIMNNNMNGGGANFTINYQAIVK